MATLRCTKCGKTFKSWFVKNYAHVGLKSGAGLSWTLVVWPFTLRVYAKCPNCGEITWMEVLKPKIFGRSKEVEK
ncbi:MAG: hypothetical protein K6343_05315 [Caldisericaceae bacterium]